MTLNRAMRHAARRNDGLMIFTVVDASRNRRALKFWPDLRLISVVKWCLEVTIGGGALVQRALT